MTLEQELPEPLTSADCDLRGMPFMPIEIGRLFDSDLYALSIGEGFSGPHDVWLSSIGKPN